MFVNGTGPHPWRWTTAWVALLAGLSIMPARAMNMPALDLDSLVYQSDQIVEGEVLQADKVQWRNNVQVKITAVDAGTLQPGQVFTWELGIYRKDMADNELTVGDKLFLFLAPPDPGFWNHGSKSNPDTKNLTPIASGLKLVVDDQTYGVMQFGNPGPYQFMVSATPWGGDGGHTSPGGPALTVAQLREAIADSEKKSVAWHAWFKTDPTPEEIPRLLALLRERAAATPLNIPDFQYWDVIEQTAQERLAKLHAYAALYQALLLHPKGPFMPFGTSLSQGFGTPAGREFLLRTIADPAEPRDHRLILAESCAGGFNDADYWAKSDDEAGTGVKPPEDQDPKNHSYLTRIAQLAADTASDPDISCAVLDTLKNQLRNAGSREERAGSSVPRPPDILADRDGALAVLTAYYPTASGEERYAIQNAMLAAGAPLPKQIAADRGPVFSVVQADPADYPPDPSAKPALVLRFRTDWLPGSENITSVVLVLQSTTTDKNYVVNLPDKIDLPHTHGSEGGNFSVDLPAGVPHGSYKVFMRFLAGDAVAQDGEGFVAKL
jgi:hypothetical protein